MKGKVHHRFAPGTRRIYRIAIVIDLDLTAKETVKRSPGEARRATCPVSASWRLVRRLADPKRLAWSSRGPQDLKFLLLWNRIITADNLRL